MHEIILLFLGAVVVDDDDAHTNVDIITTFVYLSIVNALLLLLVFFLLSIKVFFVAFCANFSYD